MRKIMIFVSCIAFFSAAFADKGIVIKEGRVWVWQCHHRNHRWLVYCG